MEIQKRREIVIEFERVQIVRKKAETHLVFCRQCGREVDFVPLREAALLFTTPPESLLRFVRISNSHFEAGANGEILICLVALLARMKARTNGSQIKMIED